MPVIVQRFLGPLNYDAGGVTFAAVELHRDSDVPNVGTSSTGTGIVVKWYGLSKQWSGFFTGRLEAVQRGYVVYLGNMTNLYTPGSGVTVTINGDERGVDTDVTSYLQAIEVQVNYSAKKQ